MEAKFLRRAFRYCFEKQEKETKRKVLIKDSTEEKILKLGPKYYDGLVAYAGCSVLQYFHNVEDKRFFYNHLANYSIRDILKEMPGEFENISDLKLREFFEEESFFATNELFHTLVTISDKIRFINLINTSDVLAGTDLLTEWWLDGDGQLGFFDFLEEISCDDSCKKSEDFIYSSILAKASPELLAKGINLYPGKIKVINRILKSLMGEPQRLAEVVNKITPIPFERIAEKCDLDIWEQLKGQKICQEAGSWIWNVYERAYEAGKIHEIFNVSELVYFYENANSFQEQKDIVNVLFKDYPNEIQEFYDTLSDEYINEFLVILVETSDVQGSNLLAKDFLKQRIEVCKNEEKSSLIPQLLLKKVQET